jgi:hypothetical protein
MMKQGFLALIIVVLGACVSSCGIGDFDPASLLNGVRILATRADKPYALPGDKVTLEALAYDGRAERPRPMKLYWLPVPCINPERDLYYLCFSALTGRGSQSGAPANPAADLLRPGVDLSPFLPTGPTYSFDVPADIISNHAPTPGAPDPYGLVIVFNIACAGHIEILAVDPNNKTPQQIPIGCFDESRNQLGPEDFVIGFTRVYVYANRTNQNPVIEGMTLDGTPIDQTAGITLERCLTSRRGDCPKHDVQVVVPDASHEENPSEPGPDGTVRREQVYVTYYVTTGQLEGDSRLIFDAKEGRVPKSEAKYLAPNDPAQGLLFAVLKDSRGGASWWKVPLHVH